MKLSSLLKRSLSAVLCLAIALSFCSAFSGTAKAAVSLPAIENIKSSGVEFNILEIVPYATQGSIGYYIDGEEPWVTLAGTKPSKTERTDFVNNELQTLLNQSYQGTLPSDPTESEQNQYYANYFELALCNPKSGYQYAATSENGYPLSYVGDYKEAYPWEKAASPDTYADYDKHMRLAEAEKSTVSGTMAYVGMSYGDYIVGDYEYLGPGGPCLQLITGFKTEPDEAEDGFWYNVSFTPLDDEEEVAKWSVVYEMGSGTDSDLELGGNRYKFVGIVGTRDFAGLEIGKSYCTAVGQPYANKAAAEAAADPGSYTLFADISGGFRDKEIGETGYFSKISYDYLGEGKGAYSFTPASSGTTCYLSTDIVWYKGGSTNNNWFLKHIFDYDENEIDEAAHYISVNTVSADTVTTKLLNSADMIVLNYGLNIVTTSSSNYNSVYKNDFPSGISAANLPMITALATAAENPVPVIFDYNLKDSANISVKDSADALLTAATGSRIASGFTTVEHHSFVGGGIYCSDVLGWTITEEDQTTTVKYAGLPLATTDFNMPGIIKGDNLAKSGPFYPVYEEIYYENFLRKIRDESAAKLSSEITLASVLRYIINYANTRHVAPKTEIKVLDLEPRTGSMTQAQQTQLRGWLADSAGIPAESINLKVTTMSTSAFNGLERDISEDYDLLYIGDSSEGYSIAFGSYGGFLGLGGTKFDYIEYSDSAMTYNSDENKSKINKTTIEKYITNRQELGWFFNVSDAVFGLRYTAVGDKVKSGENYKLSGLLARDYNGDGDRINSDSSQANIFRYSGNDLTATSKAKIEDFAGSGYPVLFADTLIKAPEFSGSITTAKATFKGRIFNNINCEADPSLTCEGLTLKVHLDPTLSGGFSTPNIIGKYRINTAACTLYKDGITEPIDSKPISPFSDASFNLADYDIDMSGEPEFYCKVEISSGRSVLLPFLTYTNRTSNTVGQTKTVAIFNEAEEMFVDNSSVMYETINSIAGKTNVIRWTALESTVTSVQQTLLSRFVNLSKPEIVFWNEGYPTPYEMDAGGVMTALEDDYDDGIYNLEYVFKIQNESDPYPATTRYQCRLYLDFNGNGIFEEAEALSDIALRDWIVYSEDYGSSGQRVTNGQLQGSYGSNPENQHYYYLSYQLPADMLGIVPWKLEVKDVTYFGGHDSVSDLTRIAPEVPDVLNVLQIDSVDSNNHFSLQQNIEEGGIYKTLLDKVGSDFIVNISTIKADFDSTWVDNTSTYTTHDGGTVEIKLSKQTKQNKDTYKKVTTVGESKPKEESFDSIGELLKSYDMLIIGFGDAYHNLSLELTKALESYIKSDKPVLMTHDTNSFYSLNNGNYQTTNNAYVYGQGSPVYNYYPNMLLRDLVGTDRYGVTSLKPARESQSIGINKYCDSGLKAYIKTASDYKNWAGGYVPSQDYSSNEQTINAGRRSLLSTIEDEGYSIAWKPYSARSKTVAETQGLTTGILFRFHTDGPDYPDANFPKGNVGLTTKVTQQNKGQITSYPYDVNTEAFRGEEFDSTPSDSMEVAPTHGQYYQLNMNSDEMIVWYNLSTDETDESKVYADKNDSANNYYIYTCRNVTYTGSGHTTDSINENEAKLFVNTMIAAYRVEREQSNISFSNEDGSVKGIENFFVVTDGNYVLSTNEKYSDSTRNIYFTPFDTNAGEGKIMKVSFSYGKTKLALPIYEAESGQKVYDGSNFVNDNTTLYSNYTYYIKLDDVLKAAGSNISVSALNKDLKVTLSTTYSSGSATATTSEATLTLKQYELFDLS